MPNPSLPVGTKVTPNSAAHPFYGKVFVVLKEIATDVEDGAEHVITEIEGFAHTVEVKLFHKDVAVSAVAPVVETPAPAPDVAPTGVPKTTTTATTEAAPAA